MLNQKNRDLSYSYRKMLRSLLLKKATKKLRRFALTPVWQYRLASIPIGILRLSNGIAPRCCNRSRIRERNLAKLLIFTPLEPLRKPGSRLAMAGVSAKVHDACQVSLALIRTSLASFKTQDLMFVKHSVNLRF